MRRTRQRGPAVLLGALSIAVLGACGDDLSPGWRIASPRILAVQAQMPGDAQQAWPLPSETTQVRAHVVHPGAPTPLAWALAVCPELPVLSGVGGCAGPVLGAAAQEVPVPQPPQLSFTAPSAAETDEVTTLRIGGVLCPPPGTLNLDFEALLQGRFDTLCPGSEATQSFVFALPIATVDERNRHPGLGASTWHFDDRPWRVPQPDRPAGSPCSDLPADVAPKVRLGDLADHTIRVVLDPSTRELRPAAGDAPALPEVLQLSSFVTSGDLDRQFSIIEAEDPVTPITLDWLGPETLAGLDASGHAVLFHFVLRDGRAGVDWTERLACVTP
ncbi:MAG: hypothetical protein ACPGUV_13270 [Polyangiales bacterium]